MSGAPRVTIAIPTYNGADYLDEAVDSALAQTCGSLEVLVLDNASTDRTPEMMARRGDPRLKYLRFEVNAGLAGNVRRGCELARGDYVMFLGADDRLMPGFAATAAAFLDAEPGVTLVHGPAAWIDEHGRRFGVTGRAWERLTPSRAAMSGAFVDGFCFSTMMVRTAAIRAAGPFDERWREVIDLWLFLRMCLAGDVGYLPEVLSEYRVHSAAMSMPMYRNNLMFRRQMTAAKEAFMWPEALAIGAGGSRRSAERAAARTAIETLHMARQDGLGKYLRNFGEVVTTVPEALAWPSTWVRVGFGILPVGVIDRLRARKHRRDLTKAAG